MTTHPCWVFLLPPGQEEAGVVCAFTYRCSGGTGENWKLQLMPVAAGRRYACTAGRPNPPSYLLMSHFTLTVEPLDKDTTTVKLDRAELQVCALELLLTPHHKQI